MNEIKLQGYLLTCQKSIYYVIHNIVTFLANLAADTITITVWLQAKIIDTK